MTANKSYISALQSDITVFTVLMMLIFLWWTRRQLDEHVVEAIATGDEAQANKSLIKVNQKLNSVMFKKNSTLWISFITP